MKYNSYDSIKSNILDSVKACQTNIDINKSLNYERKLMGYSLVPTEYNMSINISDDLIEIIKYKKNIKAINQYDKDTFNFMMKLDGFSTDLPAAPSP